MVRGGRVEEGWGVGGGTKGKLIDGGVGRGEVTTAPER